MDGKLLGLARNIGLLGLLVYGTAAQVPVRARMVAPEPPGGGPVCYGGPVGARIDLPYGPFNTTEEGGGGSFTVRLTSQPAGTVYLNVRVMDPTEGRIYIWETNGEYLSWPLYFDWTNWNVPQWITVIGIPDSEADGDVLQTFSVFNSQVTPDCPLASLSVVNLDAP